MESWHPNPDGGLGSSLMAGIAPVAATATFAGVAWWAGSLMPSEAGSLSGWGPLVWLLAGASTTEIIVHELGHVAMGIAVGLRFHAIGIGPVVLARSPAGWTAGFSPANWDGGWAGAVPRSIDQLRVNLLAFAAGGPIASLLLCLLSLLIVAAGERTPFHGMEPYAGWLAAGSAAGFVFNLIPCRFGSFRTDGAWIAELAGSRWRRLSAMFAAQAWLSYDTRPALWPSEISRWLTSHADSTMDHVQACYIAALHYLDRNELDRGSMCLEEARRLVELAGVPMPPDLALEWAYILAAVHGDTEAASRRLEMVRDSAEASPQQIRRVRAAIMAAGQHWPGALVLVDEAKAAIQGNSGMDKYERARLAELEQELEARLRLSAASGSVDRSMPVSLQ
jgi:hypothetical protein